MVQELLRNRKAGSWAASYPWSKSAARGRNSVRAKPGLRGILKGWRLLRDVVAGGVSSIAPCQEPARVQETFVHAADLASKI